MLVIKFENRGAVSAFGPAPLEFSRFMPGIDLPSIIR
jgi:hypothetical protein